jgi:hypothetical protein
MEFNFSYAPGISQQQIIGFEMAGEIWSSYLTDNVTVNIHVEMTNQLEANVIGGALPGIEANYTYKDFRKNLENDRKSWDDYFSNDNLLGKDKFSAVIKGNGKDGLVKDMSVISMTRANAKALDIVSSDNYLDGYILMSDRTNSSVKWNYDVVGNIVPTNTLDFLSVAVHEIGHILGFVSGIDDPGFLTAVVDSKNTGKKIDGKKLKYTTVLDMFRYSTSSASSGMIDLSINGENKYFSIDSGYTNVANFATGKETSLGADGEQASHWKHQDNAIGIMDPILNSGQRRQIGAIDRRAMDVIGWDVNNLNRSWQTMYNNALNGTKTAWIANRDSDVQNMVDRSQVYEWGTSTGTGTGTRKWQKSFWQHIVDQKTDLADNNSNSTTSMVKTYLVDTNSMEWMDSQESIADNIDDSQSDLQASDESSQVSDNSNLENFLSQVRGDKDLWFLNNVLLTQSDRVFTKEDPLLKIIPTV